MLSKRAKYGLRALVHFAQHQVEGPLQIGNIAETLNIPRKFLEAILLDLRNEGILQSRKGREGGYYMERSPDTIPLGRIIRFIDGPLASVPCVSQTAYAHCNDCPDGKTFLANKYVFQNGDSKSLMIYWYQGRGRAIASEYWGKIYTVIDSVRLRRSDGAMVRVTVPVGSSEAVALQAATELAAGATAALPDFVPN